MLTFSIDYLTRKEESTSSTNVNHHGDKSYNSGLEDSRGMESNDINTTTTKQHGTEKPTHSYIALISMAILDQPDKKILVGDIYKFIMDKFPYFNNKEKAWRNSIRHNLSLNECFIKNGRDETGKGNFWSIHPACIEDFSKGDFRRREARRKARKSGTPGMNEGELPVGFRCNLDYVKMTTSTIPYKPIQTSAYGLTQYSQSTISTPYFGCPVSNTFAPKTLQPHSEYLPW